MNQQNSEITTSTKTSGGQDGAVAGKTGLSTLVQGAEAGALQYQANGDKTSNPCSSGLWRLLTEGDDFQGAVRIIAINPKLRAEAAKNIDAIEAMAAPIQKNDLLARLIKMAPVFHIGDREPEEWETVLNAYLEAMGELTTHAVEQSISGWIRGDLYPKDPGRHAFFPKPAELMALAKPHQESAIKARFRARRALEYVDQSKPEKSEAERAADRQKAIEAGILNPDGSVNLTPKGSPSPQRPATSETPQQVAQRLRDMAAQYDGSEAV